MYPENKRPHTATRTAQPKPIVVDADEAAIVARSITAIRKALQRGKGAEVVMLTVALANLGYRVTYALGASEQIVVTATK